MNRRAVTCIKLAKEITDYAKENGYSVNELVTACMLILATALREDSIDEAAILMKEISSVIRYI